MTHRRYYFYSSLSLLLFLWAFSNQVHKPALPANFDLHAITYPASVQGISAGTARELEFIVEGWAPGELVEIIPSGGNLQTVSLIHADSISYRITAFSSGIFFWLIAAFVLAPRCDEEATRYFFWMTLLYGLGIGLGGVYYLPESWSQRTFFNLMQFGVLAFLPPVFMGLAQTFPRILPVRKKLKRLIPIMWGIAS